MYLFIDLHIYLGFLIYVLTVKADCTSFIVESVETHVSFANISISRELTEKIFSSPENLSLMSPSINEVSNTDETASLSITTIHIPTFRSPTFMKIWRTLTRFIYCSEAEVSLKFINNQIF